VFDGGIANLCDCTALLENKGTAMPQNTAPKFNRVLCSLVPNWLPVFDYLLINQASMFD